MKIQKLIKTTLALILTISVSACGKTESYHSPQEVIDAINKEADTMISTLEKEYTSSPSQIDSYEAYIQNADRIAEWYATMNETTKEFFTGMEKYYEAYYRMMLDTCKNNDELKDSLELFYEEVYEGTFEDLYKKLYEGLFKDIYEDIYEDVLSKADDIVSYDELYSSCSTFYDAWYDAGSTCYDTWYNGLSRFYSIWSAMYGSIYDGNRDYDSLMQEVDKEETESDTTDTEQEEKPVTDQEEETVEEVIEQPQQPAETSGIRPEFQQAMDDYMAFFEEYCDFMIAMSNSENDLSLLGQYADFMARYTETMNSFEAIDENELSDEELALYIDTTAQIQKMLLEVA